MMHFHHIGMAVEGIDGFRKNLEELFHSVKTGPVTFDPEQNAYICMAELPGGLNLELIQGEVVKNLVKKGIAYYHLCFTVSNLESALEEITAQNGILVRSPAPAVLFNGKRIAFVNTHLGLIELLEDKNENSAT